MQDMPFEPITLCYEGLDADDNLIDLGQLGLSIRGAAKLIAAGGQLALTGTAGGGAEYRNALRVLTAPPKPGSYLLEVIIGTVAPLAPMLPIVGPVIKTAYTKIVEASVNAVIAKLANKPIEAATANDVAIKAMEELGRTSRDAIAALGKMSATHHRAIKQLVAPVGQSVGTAQIGRREWGAVKITAADRSTIERPEIIEVSPETRLLVNLTELDLVNRSCKASIIGGDEPTRRVIGQITDPQIAMPNNPYSTAVDDQKPLWVKAKLQHVGGQVDRLFISDTAGD